MQRKQPPKELPPSSQNIMATILQSMPKEASITKIEYEGPRIALYTNSPRYLLENNETISKECVQMVRNKIGPVAAFKIVIVIKRLPKTRSGKIMRRILRKIAANEHHQLGDTTTLADPSVVQSLVDNRKNI